MIAVRELKRVHLASIVALEYDLQVAKERFASSPHYALLQSLVFIADFLFERCLTQLILSLRTATLTVAAKLWRVFVDLLKISAKVIWIAKILSWE